MFNVKNIFKISSIVFLIAMITLLLAEGFTSLCLNIIEKSQSTRSSTVSTAPHYFDKYQKKYVRQIPLGNYFTDIRYAPFSLAEFYYLNESFETPLALFTDQYGFIHNGDPYRNLRQKITGTRTLFMGGSSAAGANSTSKNERTISAFIERNINLQTKKENQVVNGAVGGYESFRELILAQHLVGQFDFDTFIFFDGRNDWFRLSATEKFFRNYYPESEALFQLRSGNTAGPGQADTFFKSFQFYRLAKALKKHYLSGTNEMVAPTTGYLKIGNNKLPKDAFVLNQDDLFKPREDGSNLRKELDFRKEALENYLDNIRSMAGFCIAHGKRCIIALQPTLGLGPRLLLESEKAYFGAIPFNHWGESQTKFFNEASKAFKLLALEYSKTSVEFIDLTTVFDAVNQKAIFLDSIHYLDEGNCILGAAFTAQLLRHDWRKMFDNSNNCMNLSD